MDDHQFTKDDFETRVVEIADACAQLVLKCLYLARICRPDFFWTVDALARAITKRNRACGKSLARLMSYLKMHFGSSTILSCWMNASGCKLALIQDADLAGGFTDSKSTSGGMVCVFGDHTFVII